MPADLATRFRQGDRQALSKLLSAAARGEALSDTLPAPQHPACVVAVTGAGGVGKSSILGKLIDVVRAQGQRVAVLACDPQSPLTGGAILGDRFRMGSRTDDGVFIRSLATPGGHGALAEHLPALVRLLESFGFDVIFLETVGAGQGDTSVRALADVVVLLLQPEAGDDIQWEKAGVLEVADIIAVNKADLPGSEQTAAQVRAALDLSAQSVQVVRVSAKTGAGVADLWQAIGGCPSRRAGDNGRYEMLHRLQDELARRFHEMSQAGDGEFANLLASWRNGEVPAAVVVDRLIRLVAACRETK